TYRATPSLAQYIFNPETVDFSAFAPALNFSGYFIGCGGFVGTPITVGQTLSGVLELTDCHSPTFGTSYFVDRYSFSGVAGQEVVVQVASVEIFPEIALLRPSYGAAVGYGYSGTGLARLPGSAAVGRKCAGVNISQVVSV